MSFLVKTIFQVKQIKLTSMNTLLYEIIKMKIKRLTFRSEKVYYYGFTRLKGCRDTKCNLFSWQKNAKNGTASFMKTVNLTLSIYP